MNDMTEAYNEEINLLELIPERNVDYEAGEDNIVTLLAPRFRSRFLPEFLKSRLKRKKFKVDLDKIGSFVWLRCDGTRTAGQIADEMAVRFGKEAEPVAERLGIFFGQLEKLRYIRFSNIEECHRKKNISTQQNGSSS